VPSTLGEGGLVRIQVDVRKCIGSGACVVAAPDVFDQGDDGIVVVLQEDVPEGDEATLEAAKTCPAAVIDLRPSS
jgi:ferredoxin